MGCVRVGSHGEPPRRCAPSVLDRSSARLYLDPGDGYDYRAGKYAYRKFVWSYGVLSSTSLHHDAAYEPNNELERVEVT
jgi:hypothetical protein